MDAGVNVCNGRYMIGSKKAPVVSSPTVGSQHTGRGCGCALPQSAHFFPVPVTSLITSSRLVPPPPSSPRFNHGHGPLIRTACAAHTFTTASGSVSSPSVSTLARVHVSYSASFRISFQFRISLRIFI
jgi:hypothetical protein